MDTWTLLWLPLPGSRDVHAFREQLTNCDQPREFYEESMTDSVRHILSLSGGKDSTALAAIYFRDQIAEMEYVFCSDTKKELPETYQYLDKIEAYLGKPIVRLCDDRGFDH